MFVRWQRRRLKRYRQGCDAGEEVLSAVVVESRRVDGKPRQKMIRYLGTVRESDITRPRPMSLDRFWTRVDGALDELGIHGAARLVMESTVKARVPRPDPEQLERTRAEFDAWKGGMQSMMQSMASGRRPRQPRRRQTAPATV